MYTKCFLAALHKCTKRVCCILIVILLLVPSAAPQNFNASNVNDSIVLTWQPPPLIDQNGIIIMYNYTYFGLERDRTPRSETVDGTMTSVQSVLGLDAFTNYTFTVSAITSVGQGPASPPVSVITGVERKYFQG